MSEPSHIDKPPIEHDVVIEEDVARSMLRDANSGNSMSAIQMKNAGITTQDLKVQTDFG